MTSPNHGIECIPRASLEEMRGSAPPSVGRSVISNAALSYPPKFLQSKQAFCIGHTYIALYVDCTVPLITTPCLYLLFFANLTVGGRAPLSVIILQEEPSLDWCRNCLGSCDYSHEIEVRHEFSTNVLPCS